MSYEYPVGGKARWISSRPANTSEATLWTAKKGNALTQLWICNETGSAANATFKIGDGTTDYSLIDTYPISAYGYLEEVRYFPMGDGYTVKITSGTANALTFTIVILEGQSAALHSPHQSNV